MSWGGSGRPDLSTSQLWEVVCLPLSLSSAWYYFCLHCSLATAVCFSSLQHTKLVLDLKPLYVLFLLSGTPFPISLHG